MKVKSMQINISDEEIRDLHKRLKNTRWPPPIAGSNWDDGTDGSDNKILLDYWELLK